MEQLLAKWVGKKIQVTLRSTIPAVQHGMLVAISDSAIMVEIQSIQSVIPACSILHISLSSEH